MMDLFQEAGISLIKKGRKRLIQQITSVIVLKKDVTMDMVYWLSNIN